MGENLRTNQIRFISMPQYREGIGNGYSKKIKRS